MKSWQVLQMTAIAAVIGAVVASSPAVAVDPNRIIEADMNPNDWLTYHGSYKSWHYSALDQINVDTVKGLKVAWEHHPGRATRGLEAFPLVADGVLYYAGSYSRLYALDATTGDVIWSYIPELNEDLVATQTHVPYNRGVALGFGNVYVGTVDGRLLAVPVKTDPTFSWGTATVVIDGDYLLSSEISGLRVFVRRYDMDPLGERFLLLKPYRCAGQ